MTQEWEYRFEHGSYYFYGGNGSFSFMCDEVAFGYDQMLGDVIMLKHGSPENVEAAMDKMRRKMRDSGMAEDFGMVNATKLGWSLDSINRCLSTTGYLGIMLKTMDVEVTVQDD